MRGEWRGDYLDGRTAARRPATVRLHRTGLEISPEGGGTLWWPYREVRQTQGFYAGEQVRLEHGPDPAAVLLVSDPAFLADLREAAPDLGRRFHDPARRLRRAGWTVLAALGAAAAGAVLYLWGIPALAALAAARVPVAWEERLGEAALEHLAPPARRCETPRLAVLDAIVAALARTRPDAPYRFRILVVDDPRVNAFAVPGGSIVLLRGLLADARTPEELAGIVAHEMQHILHRHATRALARDLSTGLLLAALTGEASGALAYGLDAARRLGTLRYSRQAEEEADAEGLRMLLAAGVDPRGLIAFLERVQAAERGSPALPTYLTTHPPAEGRLARLRAQAAAAPRPARRFLPEADWEAVRRACEGASR